MATETLTVLIRQRGARSVQKQLRDIAGNAGQADSALRGMNRTMGALVTGALVRQLATAADTFTLLQSRTRVFATSAADAEDRLDGIVATAIETRAPLDAVATVFQRLSIAQDAAGLTTQDLTKITGTLTKAIAVSGATAQEAEGALRQLAQGIAANRLSGQEFNSVIEQTPRIAQAISDSLGVQMGALRGLANQGKLTRDVVIQSFKAQAATIDAEFKKVLPTLGQSFQVLKTSVTVFIGELDRITGTSSKVAKGIIAIGKSILAASTNTEKWVPLLEKVLIVLVGIAAVKTASVVLSIAAAIASLNTKLIMLAVTNPFIAIATALVTVVGLAVAFRNEVVSIGGQSFRLKELASVIIDKMIPGIEAFISEMTGLENFEIPGIKRVFNDLVNGFNISSQVVWLFLKRTAEGFTRLNYNLGDLFGNIPLLIAAGLLGDTDEVSRLVAESFRGGFTSAFSGFGDEVSLIVKQELSVDNFKFLENAAANSDLLTEASRRTAVALKEEAAAAEAAAKAAAAEGFKPDKPIGVVDIGLDEKGFKRLQKATLDVIEEFEPAIEVTREFAERVMVMDTAIKAAVVTDEQYATTIRLVTEEFSKAMGVINSTSLDSSKIDSVRDSVLSLMSEFDPALELTLQFVERTQLLQTALEQGVITNLEYAASQREVNEAFADGLSDIDPEGMTAFQQAVRGTREGFKGFIKDLGTVESNISEGLNGALNTSVDALTEWATGGKVSGKVFARALISSITKVIIKMLVLKAIQAAVGMPGGIPGGSFLSFGAGKAQGGPVNPGTAYPVGERGPEMFVPDSRGTVIPNDMLGARSQPPINLQVVNVDDPDAVPQALNTSAGEEAVINVIQRNPDILREIA